MNRRPMGMRRCAAALAELTLLAAILLAALAGGCCPFRPCATAQPEEWDALHPVLYAQTPPTIDGRLDDTAWAQAEPITRFYEFKEMNHRVAGMTAYLAWDEANLYCAFRIEDADLYALESKSDGFLWNGDVGEFFFKPSETSLDLYEFDVNPLGGFTDIHYIGRGGGPYQRFKAYSSGARVAVQYAGTLNNWEDSDGGWAVEMAIPMSAFSRAVPGGPRPGDVWKFNVGGYDYSVYLEEVLRFTCCDGSTKWLGEYQLFPMLVFHGP